MRVFDPGVPSEIAKNEQVLNKKRIYPDIRPAESRYVAILLRTTLEVSGQWGAVRVCPQNVQFGFAHGALEPEQQAVVEVRRVVHAVLVADERARHRRQLEQALPVGVVACEPRDLQTQNQSHVPKPHIGHEPLKAEPISR